MTHVEVLVEDDRWKSINFEDLVTKAFYETLKKLGYSKTDYFISVLGCNDKKMRKLNLMFRSKDTSTNVLSWPSRERLRVVRAITRNRLTGLWMLNLEISLWLMKLVFRKLLNTILTLHHMCSI